MNEQQIAIANTTWQQIKNTVENVFVIWSWGLSKNIATIFQDMVTLKLRVSGVYHKGWVYASYNEAKDLYEIRLFNIHNKQKGDITEAYCDNIGEVIDRLVERGTTSEKEYQHLAMADTKNKLA